MFNHILFNLKQELNKFMFLLYYDLELSRINKPTILFVLISFLNIGFLIPGIYYLQMIIIEYLWWLSLGVLSSIGFGTGIQTGMLFVFPKIIESYRELLNSNTNRELLNSNTHRELLSTNRELLNSNTSISNDINSTLITTTIYQTYFKCFLFVFVWGIGTALGELPPYFIAFNIKKNRQRKNSNAINKLYRLLGDKTNTIKKTVESIVYKFKKNEKYRFYFLIAFSAWPNAIFDLCGVAAGLAGLSLREFLIPIMIGKAGIKIPIQLGFIIYSYAYYDTKIGQTNDLGYLYYSFIILVGTITFYFMKMGISNYIENNRDKLITYGYYKIPTNTKDVLVSPQLLLN